MGWNKSHKYGEITSVTHLFQAINRGFMYYNTIYNDRRLVYAHLVGTNPMVHSCVSHLQKSVSTPPRAPPPHSPNMEIDAPNPGMWRGKVKQNEVYEMNWMENYKLGPY